MCDDVAGDQLSLYASVAFSKCESAFFTSAHELFLSDFLCLPCVGVFIR